MPNSDNPHANGDDAQTRQAIAMFEAGQSASAKDLFNRILKASPDNTVALRYLAIMAVRQGAVSDAINLQKKALRIQPADAILHYELGLSYKSINDLDKARDCYLKAIEQNSTLYQAHFNLANLLANANEIDAAESYYLRALAVMPQHHPSFGNLCLLYDKANKAKTLETLCQKYSGYYSGSAYLYYFMGRAFDLQGLTQKAIDAYGKALTLDASFIDALYYRALVYHKMNRLDGAFADLTNAAAIKEVAYVYHYLGVLFHEQRDNDQAIENYQKALALHPGNIDTLCNLSELLEKNNQLEQAQQTIDEALKVAPEHPLALRIKATLLRRQDKVEEAIKLLENVSIADEDSLEGINVHFEQGKLYDLHGDTDKAFHHFGEGNKHLAKLHGLQKEKQTYLRQLDQIEKTFTQSWVDSWPPSNQTEDLRAPAFLVGFPRSGTTLLDQMLDSHPAIRVIDERPVLAQTLKLVTDSYGDYPQALANIPADKLPDLQTSYFDAAAAFIGAESADSLVIDKLPLNLVHAGFAHRLFPGAKFILALRHPCDACLSCFMQPFAPNESMANFYTLEETVLFYDRVMSLWKQYVALFGLEYQPVKYESLIENYEQETRRLFEFLGVGWSDEVLNYLQHAKNRDINTPSYSQVVQPIYKSARYRWQNYRQFFEPYFHILKPYVDEFGYSLD